MPNVILDQEVINLSKEKWRWMSERNVETLLAVVGGTSVTNPFMVTEVYVQQDSSWQLASLSFTRLLTPQ